MIKRGYRYCIVVYELMELVNIYKYCTELERKVGLALCEVDYMVLLIF